MSAAVEALVTILRSILDFDRDSTIKRPEHVFAGRIENTVKYY